MANRVQLCHKCSALYLVLNIILLVASASTSTLSVEDTADGAKDSPTANRNIREIQFCLEVGLEKKAAYWNQFNENSTVKPSIVNADNFVVVYQKISSRADLRWILEFVEKIWDHIKQKTVCDGSKDKVECLAVVIHERAYSGNRHVYAMNKSTGFSTGNILDIGTLTTSLWTDMSKRNEAEDLITNQLAYLVEFSSNCKFGSPSSHIWKSPSSQDSAWVEIFTYDIYKALNLTEKALLNKNQLLLKSHETTFPKNRTFWFRDWFLPIYENYGGSAVLSKYFEILATKASDSYYQWNSTKKINMGEFVHFWSGAAGIDLTPLAWKAFGWTRQFQKDLTVAQTNPMYTITEEKYNWTDSIEEGDSGSVEITDSGNKTDESTTNANNGFGTERDNFINKINLTLSSNEGKGNDIVIGISTGAVIFVLVMAFIIFVIYYKNQVRMLRTEMRSLTNKEVKDFFEGDPNVRKDELLSLIHASPFIKDYEISFDRLVLGNDVDELGSGEYGRVIRGFIRQLDSNELLPVAIKTVKKDVEVAQFKAMLCEVKIMAYLGQHENIVLLCGTHTANIRRREIYIALELCTLGDLRKYLKNHKEEFRSHSLSEGHEEHSEQIVDRAVDAPSFSLFNLFKWSHDISNAMIYLSEKKVIHGDLAARNVLLTSNRVAKVSDFGLSRQLLNYASYMKTTKTPLPWRWLAIESLKDMEFSVASDVWAYGVTLWEIFSLGDTPYAGWTWDYRFVDKLVGGDRLDAPANANAVVSGLMQDCWKLSPSMRPSFQTIYNSLSDLMRMQKKDVEPNYITLRSLSDSSSSSSF